MLKRYSLLLMSILFYSANLFVAGTAAAAEIGTTSFFDSTRIESLTTDDYISMLDRFKEKPPLTLETVDLYVAFGFCHYQVGDYILARDILQSVVNIAPTSFESWALLGLVHKALGEADHAQQAFLTSAKQLRIMASSTADLNRAWVLERMVQ